MGKFMLKVTGAFFLGLLMVTAGMTRVAWAQSSYISGFNAGGDGVRNDDGIIGADDSVSILVDIDDGGVGQFIVADYDGGNATRNIIVADAGTTTLGSNTVAVTNNITVGGTLTTTGNATVGGNLDMDSGNITNAAAITASGTIQGATLTATGDASVGGSLDMTNGNVNNVATLTATTVNATNLGATTLQGGITGNGQSIAGVSTLSTTGNATIGGNLDMDGGTIGNFASIGNVAQATFKANTDGIATDEGFSFIVGDADGDGVGGGVTTETAVYFDENNIALNEDTAITGTLGVSGATTVTGLTTLNGGLTMDAGVFTVADGTGAVHTSSSMDIDGNLDVGNGNFTVAAASGNTAVAGTLGVTGLATMNSGATISGGTTSITSAANGHSITVDNSNTTVQGGLQAYGSTGSTGGSLTVATNYVQMTSPNGRNNVGTDNSRNQMFGDENVISSYLQTKVVRVDASGTLVNGGMSIYSGDATDRTSLNTTGNGLVVDATSTRMINTTNANTIASSSAGNTIAGTTNTLTGLTNINVSNNAATNINTGTSTSAVTIGNSANTTSINSATNNIGVNAFATANNIGTNSAAASTNIMGSTNTATTVAGYGGNSYVSVANGTASLRSGSGATASGLITTSASQTLSSNTATLASQLNNVGDANSRANVAGASYVNRLEGNTLINGNTYINGTLVYSSNTAATTTVTSGASILTGAAQDTDGEIAIVNAGGSSVTADANGVITSGIVAETTGSLVLTNGIGETHGFVVTEQKAVISGGTHSTTLTLDDGGATFHSTTTESGAARVTGVEDGQTAYDAVNYKQLKSMETTAHAGIASVAALAAIPGPVPGKNYSIGAGVGHFKNQDALALGVVTVVGKKKDISIRAGFGYSRDEVVTNAGVGWSF